MAGDWTTVAAAAVGAIAGMSGGTFVEMYKRRRDRISTACALAGAIYASVQEVRQFKVLEALTDMANNLDKEPDSPFTAGKLFQGAPVKFNLTVFEKNIDRLGLISPELSERVILWFSSYAGFQHTLWNNLHRCDTNKQASALVHNIGEMWVETEMQAGKLAADLVRSAR